MKTVLPRCSRREFLRTSAAAGLLTALPLRGLATAPAGGAARARNLIFLVSDGMSAGAFTIAERFASEVQGRRTSWVELLEQPGVHGGLMDTASANSLVTDSAAASSSWGCGRRVPNGRLNTGPAGESYEPLLVKARRAGKATGLVTTTRATHATPAGFLVNADSRNSEDDIAAQYLERGIDVCLGGGARHFLPSRREDGRDIAGGFAAAGHAVVFDRAALLAAPVGQPVLGLFHDNDHLPFVIDRAADPAVAERTPALAEMARAALDRLARNPRGFVLQIEGGRVDHAAHNNDAAALLHEQLDFDAAVAVALEFQRSVPDTLVVVTTDHGNSNPGLNAGGKLRALGGIRASFDRLLPQVGAAADAEAARAVIAEATGLPVKADEAEAVQAALRGDPRALYQPMRAARAVLGQVLANYLAIGWVGVSHTGDHVIFTAVGPGAERFPALVRNDAVHAHVCAELGLG